MNDFYKTKLSRYKAIAAKLFVINTIVKDMEQSERKSPGGDMAEIEQLDFLVTEAAVFVAGQIDAVEVMT